MIQQITIYDPGFDRPASIDAIDPSCSWSIKDTGSMSTSIERKAKDSLPFDVLIGRWMTWYTKAGLWSGMINKETFHIGSRYIEIEASDLRSVFKGRLTGNKVYGAKPPGSHFLRICNDTDSNEPFYIDNFEADEDGEPITFSVRDDDLFDIVNNLVGSGGDEHGWRVKVNEDTLETTAEFRDEIGKRLWDKVHVVEGVHPLDGDYTVHRDGIVNSLLGIANDDNYANKHRYLAEDGDSIESYGKIQAAKRYTGLVTRGTIYTVTRMDMLKLHNPPGPISFPIANIDGIYNSFLEGDTILVSLTTPGKVRRMRVETRSLGSDGILSISGSSVSG